MAHVNWQFKDDDKSTHNWKNRIVPVKELSRLRRLDHQERRNKQSDSKESGTDSLDTDDESEFIVTSEQTLQSDPFLYIKKSTTKKELLISSKGKKSPLLKVSMVPPSPSTDNFKQSITDLRLNLMNDLASQKARKGRLKKISDAEELRNEFIVDYFAAKSSRRGGSLHSMILSPGSEYYSVSHHVEIMKHQCKKFSCETLTREQFYSRYIHDEKYLSDIWALTQKSVVCPPNWSALLPVNIPKSIPSLWKILIVAQYIQFEKRNRFYWQKSKHTNKAACLSFNMNSAACASTEISHGYHFCLCCGSVKHGASSCNVLEVLDKILRHFAKKCGMSLKGFENALGIHGETPAYVVTHKNYSENNTSSSRSEQNIFYLNAISNSSSTDSSKESETIPETNELEEASGWTDSFKKESEILNYRTDISPTFSNAKSCSETLAVQTVIDERHKQKRNMKHARATRRTLTKEFTKASFEESLHRRSDMSFAMILLSLVMSLFCYFFFYLRSPISEDSVFYA